MAELTPLQTASKKLLGYIKQDRMNINDRVDKIVSSVNSDLAALSAESDVQARQITQLQQAGGQIYPTSDQLQAAYDQGYGQVTTPTTGGSTGGTTTPTPIPTTDIQYSVLTFQDFSQADSEWKPTNGGSVTVTNGVLSISADATRGANKVFNTSGWTEDHAIRFRVKPALGSPAVSIGSWWITNSWGSIAAQDGEPNSNELVMNVPAGSGQVQIYLGGPSGQAVNIDEFSIELGDKRIPFWHIPDPIRRTSAEGVGTLVPLAENSPFTKRLPVDVPRFAASSKAITALRDIWKRDSHQPTLNTHMWGIADIFRYDSRDLSTFTEVKLGWHNNWLWNWVPEELYGPNNWSYTFRVDPATADDATRTQLRQEFWDALYSDPNSPFNSPSDPNGRLVKVRIPTGFQQTGGTDGAAVMVDVAPPGAISEGWLIFTDSHSPTGWSGQQLSTKTDTMNWAGTWPGGGNGASASGASLAATAMSASQAKMGDPDGDYGHMLAMALSFCSPNTDAGKAALKSYYGVDVDPITYPAVKTDGDAPPEYPFMIPQGFVIALDPNWKPDPSKKYLPGMLTIARTFQRYGCLINDTTHAGAGLQCSNEVLKERELGYNPWDDVFRKDDGTVMADWLILNGDPNSGYEPFPWDHCFIVDPQFYLEFS